MDKDQTLAALSALAQTHRLSIFRQLVVAGETGMTPGDLGKSLDMAPATLSFHLKELLHAGLLHKYRQSRFIYYQADFAAMNGLIRYLTENCCQGGECNLATDPCPTVQTGDTP